MENSVLKYLWVHDLMNMLLTLRKNIDEKVLKYLNLKVVEEKVKRHMLSKFNSLEFM
jgi:hypothetical protein